MSDQHPSIDDALASPLKEAVEAVLAAPLPQDAVDRVIMRAKNLSVQPATAPRPKSTLPIAAPRRVHVARRFLAIAAIVLAATGAILMFDRTTGRAFAEVLQGMKTARTVRFDTMFRLGKGRETTGRMFLDGQRVRSEQFDGTLVQIGDLDAKTALYLNVPGKLAQSMELNDQTAKAFANPIERLRTLASHEAESLGQEVLEGRRTDVYRIRNINIMGIEAAEAIIWADVESHLPAQIVVHNTDPKSETEFRFDHFVWNQPMQAEQFAMDVPQGFKTGTVVKLPTLTDDGPPNATAPMFVDGVLRDRVPGTIVWDPAGETITALMRNPESEPFSRVNELGQWNVSTGKKTWIQNVAGAPTFAMSRDGAALATVVGYEVQLRDAKTGAVTQKWATEEMLSPLAFSADGKTLAAGITEWGPNGGRGGKQYGGVQLWDVERHTLIRTQSDDKPTTFVAYSPDGKLLATSSNDGPVKLWDAATGKLAHMFPVRSRGAFSPDGAFMACISTTSLDSKVGQLDLYKIDDASLVRSFTTEKQSAASWLLGVAYSPDGRLLAATDWAGTVTVWNASTGERVQTLADYKAGVLTAAFSPDGKSLATGSEDQTLRLWNVPQLTPPKE